MPWRFPPASACVVLALLLAHALLVAGSAAAEDLEGFGEEEIPETGQGAGMPQEAAQPSGGESDGGSGSIGGGGAGVIWDEDEFEGLEGEGELGRGKGGETGQGKGGKAPGAPGGGERRARRVFQRQENYYFEIGAVIALVVYGVNVLIGRSANEAIALAWARAYVSEGGMLEKNFSMLGPGDAEEGEVLMKESQSQFKFYASGRRHCDGFLATLDLRARQDLLSVLSYLVVPRDDRLDVEVFMSEGSMPPIVLAVGVPKVVRNLARDCDDIKTYARNVSVRQLADWPSDRWAVMAESSEVFYDLIGDQFVEQVFGESAYESVGRNFRYLHFTSEMAGAAHKSVLRFSFVLPPSRRMDDIAKLMAMVPKFVDVVGTYRLSTEARRRADKNRAEESERQFREGSQARRDAIAAKKREAMEAEMERVSKLSPEEQQKWSERQARVKQRRAAKQKVIRA